ncbi:multidrug ABC transporter substrate-binding protein [Kordiimonas sediminis]|uniref:Multidrug ABC transporter substrate-binding protein n=1 Tax=Kordiimonas sediminis TaxID=1735581 RepID=A0A919AXR3_9PROT|nr:lipoprotein-releasing ABC transporter permease subunit [Kordiimonas sediminis]GHF28575.1 multidrug ABC transporter substrate-binding protein [Kordiimonas sediminis]
MGGFEWAVAKRYLSSRKRDGFISLTAILSIVAIALGVSALIIVMSVMNGFRAELMDKILGYHGHVLIQGYGGKISGYEEILKDIEDHPSIVRKMPFTESQVMVRSGDQAWGAIVRGMPQDVLTIDEMPVARIIDGDPADTSSYDSLILGVQLARRLGVGVGDDVTIISPKPIDTPFGSTLRYRAYPVAAIVEIGVFQFDESFIGMSLPLAQEFFRMPSQVSNIEVFLTDPELADSVVPQIQSKLGQRAYVRSWKSFNQALVGALQTERVAMFIVLTLIIVVAVFNIASSLFMLVKDKAADIAILRTMGARRKSIQKIFVIVGLSVGMMGIVGGCLLSWLVIANLEAIKNALEQMLNLNLWDPSIRYITSLQAIVVWKEVALTILIAVILSFIAAWVPARRAAKMDPVEVLRYE